MSCKLCQSQNQRNFGAEVALYFPGHKGLDKPTVWVFPKSLVCLACGFTEFTVPASELGVLVQGTTEKNMVVGPTPKQRDSKES